MTSYDWHNHCATSGNNLKGREHVSEYDKQWCAVYTKPQREEFAELNLRRRGVETFYPKLLLPSSAQRKCRVVSLFPNYLFVRFETFSDEYSSVAWCPGVKRLVSFNATPAIIDESVVDFLMSQTETNGVISARSNVRMGEEVCIDGGPFDGLVGIIQEPPDARGRVKVFLMLLNRPVKVEVPVEYIKAGWITPGSRVEA
jgi:transcription elongation factor/antiterminator RfaH